MDTENLIKEAKARFSHNSAKAQLADKYKSKLSLAEQGGLWEVTPNLIAFLNTLSQNTVVLIDSYGTPVKVDRQILLSKLIDTYNTVTDKWLADWEELEKKR